MLLLGEVREAESSGESQARGQGQGSKQEAAHGFSGGWSVRGTRGLGAEGSGARPLGSPLPSSLHLRSRGAPAVHLGEVAWTVPFQNVPIWALTIKRG